MGGRVKNMGVRTLLRVSHATLRALWAAVVGRRRASATSSRGRGTGGGKTWFGVLFCHECFTVLPVRYGGSHGALLVHVPYGTVTGRAPVFDTCQLDHHTATTGYF